MKHLLEFCRHCCLFSENQSQSKDPLFVYMILFFTICIFIIPINGQSERYEKYKRLEKYKLVAQNDIQTWLTGKSQFFLEIIGSVEYFGKSGGGGGMFSTLQVPVYIWHGTLLYVKAMGLPDKSLFHYVYCIRANFWGYRTPHNSYRDMLIGFYKFNIPWCLIGQIYGVRKTQQIIMII